MPVPSLLPLARSLNRWPSPCARLVRDDSGNSMIEFALGLPIMLAIYFGTLNISDAIVLQRKVVTATRALADLTTQGSSFTTLTSRSQPRPLRCQTAPRRT